MRELRARRLAAMALRLSVSRAAEAVAERTRAAEDKHDELVRRLRDQAASASQAAAFSESAAAEHGQSQSQSASHSAFKATLSQLALPPHLHLQPQLQPAL